VCPYFNCIGDVCINNFSVIRFAQRFSDNRAWHSIGAMFIKEACKEECSTLTFDTDDYWKCMIYNFAKPGNHQIGTCRMGSIDDSTAVVDPQLRYIVA